VAPGRGNTGARSAGVDGRSATDVGDTGVQDFLDDLRGTIRSGEFRPMPVRERMIPKPGGGGKMRRLGIPTLADRVVQAALKLVLEPIFEADFEPVSYGFRPRRRAHDAIAEIHLFGTRGYRWVLDADIEACFDTIDHMALMDRVRSRMGDKRVLALVKAFLKAGILTELGEERDTPTGTPQGGILSPLFASPGTDRWGSPSFARTSGERRRFAPRRRRRPRRPGQDVSCIPPGSPPGMGLVVRCPSSTSSVDQRIPLQVGTAAGDTSATGTVWSSGASDPAAPAVRATPSPSGTATLAIDVGSARHGPLTVKVEAGGPGKAPGTVYFQLFGTSGSTTGDVPSSPASSGRTLV